MSFAEKRASEATVGDLAEAVVALLVQRGLVVQGAREGNAAWDGNSTTLPASWDPTNTALAGDSLSEQRASESLHKFVRAKPKSLPKKPRSNAG